MNNLERFRSVGILGERSTVTFFLLQVYEKREEEIMESGNMRDRVVVVVLSCISSCVRGILTYDV